jgi:predicted nucleic acid-binding Zn ribbon protein
MRAHGRRVLAPYWPLAADFSRSQTPEQRAAQRGLRRRLQTLRNPIFRETQRRAVQASAARNHARFLAGVWKPPRPRDPSAGGRAAQRRRQQLAQDPVYRAWLSRRLSEGQGGRVPVACATCGTIFELPRARAQPGARRYCSRDCLRAAQVDRGRALGRARPTLMRRTDRTCRVCRKTFTGTVRQMYCSTACKSLADHRGAHGTCAVCGRAFAGEDGQQYCSRTCAIRARSAERPGARGLGYTAIAARLCVLPRDAFAALGETERQVVRLYYGLDGHGRPTQANLREQLGLEQARLRSLLLTGVARLLGTEAVGATARVCTACGTRFTPPDPWSNQRTCSATCQLERRRQNGRATSPAVRDDIRLQLIAAARRRGRPEREALRALEPEAFASLPDQERQLVRLYYGLDDTELPSVEAVAQRVGLTQAQVRRRLGRLVPQLLS